ncbi:hypothetical protein QQ045_022928 [Rhodiola kirilowii]
MEEQIGYRLRLAIVLVTAFSLLARSDSILPNPALQIANAERRIDLTSHIVKVFLTLQIENTGESLVSEALLAFPPTQVEHLSLVKAQAATGKRKKSHLPIDVNPVEVPDAPNGAKFFSLSSQAPKPW